MAEGVSSSESGTSNQKVVVKAGAWKREFEAGLKVRDYRNKLSVTGAVPDGAVAYSGTQQLSDDDIVTADMSLEFIKKTGEKG